uniref:VWFC domain-containing protein n=1 Tax=Schistocephalus solidus TaxID=70667 RepID=A0A0X3P2D9_SCHSO
MSPDSPCIQCRCINGEVDCSSSALHCRSVCLPNQETIYTGPCCEQKCITKENASPDVPAVTIKMPDSCVGLNDQATYHHGEIQIRQEECVDQRCQCINGDWFCLDFCTPLENLTCPREERIYWDKFCCPRCQGQKSCSLSVQSSHWKDLPPEGNSKKLFVSLTDREPKDSKVRGLRLGQGVRRKTAAQLATVHLQPSGQQTLSEEAEESLEGIHLVQVEPGQHVAHTEGRCVCIDGEFRCSRSGPGMWHDTDCYYADGESGDYYALGAKWTAHNDACIQCRCLAGRLYACSRTPCHSLFLCPVGQTAVATNGECCPTFCMDIDGRCSSDGRPRQRGNLQTYSLTEPK